MWVSLSETDTAALPRFSESRRDAATWFCRPIRKTHCLSASAGTPVVESMAAHGRPLSCACVSGKAAERTPPAISRMAAAMPRRRECPAGRRGPRYRLRLGPPPHGRPQPHQDPQSHDPTTKPHPPHHRILDQGQADVALIVSGVQDRIQVATPSRMDGDFGGPHLLEQVKMLSGHERGKDLAVA